MRQRGHSGRVDLNQRAIVQALEAAGCSVQSLASVGGGCPDVVVGTHGRNFLFEIKRPKVGKLTPDQEAWKAGWRGSIFYVTTAEEALEIVRLIKPW